jgi:hypothetical protein
LDIAYLWHLMGQDLILGFGESPGFAGRLSAQASFALSHLPSADLNMAIVAGEPDAEDHFREYHHVIAAAELPAIVMLASAVAERLAPVAKELGLTLAGNAPVMVHQPHLMSAPVPASSVGSQQ